jgi:hypothetical protein
MRWLPSLRLEQSFYTILQILSITLVEKAPISWVFTENYYKNKITSDHIQLDLFDFYMDTNAKQTYAYRL